MYKKPKKYPSYVSFAPSTQAHAPVSASCPPPRIRIICFFSASYIVTLEKGSARPNLAVEVMEAAEVEEEVNVREEDAFSLSSDGEEAEAAADMTAAARFSALTDIWGARFDVFSECHSTKSRNLMLKMDHYWALGEL